MVDSVVVHLEVEEECWQALNTLGHALALGTAMGECTWVVRPSSVD